MVEGSTVAGSVGVDEPGSVTDAEVFWLANGPVCSGAVLSAGDAIWAADGGSATWLSSTDTPAQATPTAAALAASHIENSISFFMCSLSLFALIGESTPP